MGAAPTSLRSAIRSVPEKDNVSSRTRARTTANREGAPPDAGKGGDGSQQVEGMAALASRHAVGFLQGALDVLGQLLSFLDPVVASLNRARHPKETIVFLLASLFILLAFGLCHYGLTLKLAAEERRHEHRMELTMLELTHSCPSTGTNVSNVLQVGPRQLRLERRISSPDEPPAPSEPPPARARTCCHLVPAGALGLGADVVDDVRRCIDDRLRTELIGAAYAPSTMGTAAAILAADFDRTGLTEGFELGEAVIAALPTEHSSSVTVVRYTRMLTYCP